MRKFVPVFLIFATFFLVALWAGVSYNQARQPKKITSDVIHTVELTSEGAKPDTLIIKTGEAIQFNAKDGHQHNIGQGRGDDELHVQDKQTEHDHDVNGLQSGVFESDEGYRLQFKQAGTYNFHDHLNPKITIVVLVYDSK